MLGNRSRQIVFKQFIGKEHLRLKGRFKLKPILLHIPYVSVYKIKTYVTTLVSFIFIAEGDRDKISKSESHASIL